MGPATTTGQPLVILNPTANRSHMAPVRRALEHWVAAHHADVRHTTKRGDAQTLARLACSQGQPIIAVGGDGTVHEVVNGILESPERVALGIVPAGSGNDFAWNTLRLPRDPEAALERAFTGTPTRVDAGMVNGHYFVNSFGTGIDADIAVAAEKMKRFPFMQGSVLYYTASLRQLLFGYRRCPWLTYSVDGADPGDRQFKHFVLIAVTNGPTYGAGFRINPEADHQDHQFDICAITYTPLPRALRLLPIVRQGKHGGLPEITFLRGNTVHIETRDTVNVQMDGETMQGKIFDIRMQAGALLVRV